jgi:hypothetical protein
MAAASSYPVVWSDSDLPVTGRLTASTERVELEGMSGDRLVTRTIDHRDLAGVRIVRAGSELLNGRPTLVVERHDAPALLVRPLGAGLLPELADLFARLCAATHRVERIAVVLPLAADALETVRELVAEGPPFDPETASLAHHEVYLTDREAIFVFSGADACESVRGIMRDSSVWPAAGRWSLCLDGPPRLAEAGYAWATGVDRSTDGQRPH